MASSSSPSRDVLLASFVTKARGIMLYEVDYITIGTSANLRLDPYNVYDINCVELLIAGRKLGHLCKEAACIVAPLKRQGLSIKAFIHSGPYSESVSRSWRFRVCDILIEVTGPKESFLAVSSALSAKKLKDVQINKTLMVSNKEPEDDVNSNASTETLTTTKDLAGNDVHSIDSESTILYYYNQDNCSSTATLDSTK